MLRRTHLVILLLVATAMVRPSAGEAQMDVKAKLGKPAPSFTLVDINGKTHRLADLAGRIVVLEWVNPNCPYVKRHYESRSMLDTHRRVRSIDKTVVWLAINSTHDTPAAQTLAWAREYRVPYPVLDDTAGAIGHIYDARRTPEMFVIDKKGTLVYRGAIDNNRVGRMPKDEVMNYVVKAVTQLAEGQAVKPDFVKPYGCRVKYGP